jgi:hypothetical protein
MRPSIPRFGYLTCHDPRRSSARPSPPVSPMCMCVNMSVADGNNISVGETARDGDGRTPDFHAVRDPLVRNGTTRSVAAAFA